MSVSGGKARFVAVPRDEVDQLEQHPDAKAIDERVMQGFAKKKPAAKKKP